MTVIKGTFPVRYHRDGDDGIGIKTITSYFLVSSAKEGITTASPGWSLSAPEMTPTNKYLWKFERIEYTDGSFKVIVPYITGVYGDNAVEVSIESDYKALPLDNNGKPIAESITISGYVTSGDKTVAITTSDNYYLNMRFVYKSGDFTIVSEKKELFSSPKKYQFDGSNNTIISNSFIRIEALLCRDVECLDIVKSITIPAIPAGQAGLSFFPNTRGYYDPTATYSWKNDTRDIVVYNINGEPYQFAVSQKQYGQDGFSGILPISDDGIVNTDYWEKSESPFRSLFANFVYTDNAQVAGFVWSDETMMSKSTVDGEIPSKERKNSKIFIDGTTGEFHATNSYVRGTVHAEQGTFENGVFKNVKMTGSYRNPFSAIGDSFDTDYNDNVVLLSDGGWPTAYNLPWDATQSGRRLSLVNYKWGEHLSQGSVSISAPGNCYFYENGLSCDTLTVSREMVELLGYGDTTTFYGWIVVKRINLATTYHYGRQLNVLAIGSVLHSPGGTVSIKYKTYDNSTMTVSRTETGTYRLYFNENWFKTSDDVRALLTGYNQQVFASIAEKTTSYITVRTSDDPSYNDASFEFMLFNACDWSNSWK